MGNLEILKEDIGGLFDKITIGRKRIHFIPRYKKAWIKYNCLNNINYYYPNEAPIFYVSGQIWNQNSNIDINIVFYSNGAIIYHRNIKNHHIYKDTEDKNRINIYRINTQRLPSNINKLDFIFQRIQEHIEGITQPDHQRQRLKLSTALSALTPLTQHEIMCEQYLHNSAIDDDHDLYSDSDDADEDMKETEETDNDNIQTQKNVYKNRQRSRPLNVIAYNEHVPLIEYQYIIGYNHNHRRIMEIEIDIDIINALYNEYNEYVSDDGGENDIEEEAIVSDEEDRNYKHNDNMNDDAYNLDVNKVDKKIKLDTTQLYQNIFDNFDNVYADDIDNILEQNPVINIEMNHNIIDKNDDHIIEEHEGGNIQQNGDDDDDEYIEQSEGHIEVIDDKTYIFPSGYKNIGPVFSYGKQWSSDIQPKYKHLKEEVLNNKYAPITEKTWNAILRKCNKILKGEFTSKKRITWSKLLKANKIGIKHLVALKLYTDFDLLQREFRKSFRAPFNKTKERLQAFFHWNKALQETFKKFSVIKRHSAIRQPHRLFHGVNSIMCLDQYEGVYYGPCSTTTDLQVARSFAGKNGMILVLKPETNIAKYKVLDVSWISDYPDEREYLLFNHKIEIETWILSSDFDEYHHYYMNTLRKIRSSQALLVIDRIKIKKKY